MAHATPAQPTAYPPTLTEIERVEIAAALTFHFDVCEQREEFTPQYELLCIVIDRMLRRRSGVQN